MAELHEGPCPRAPAGQRGALAEQPAGRGLHNPRTLAPWLGLVLWCYKTSRRKMYVHTHVYILMYLSVHLPRDLLNGIGSGGGGG